MGYEKLLLQGIPFSRLLLGPETEVQLSDLAGNAMSVSVICAAMLAALCAPELRRQRTSERNIMLKNFTLSQKYDSVDGAVLAERGDLFNVGREKKCQMFRDVFCQVARNLGLQAFQSSVLCTCESSGTTTNDSTILECTGCGMGVCHGCSGRYRVAPHTLHEINVRGDDGRPDPRVFERKLRCAVPSVLRLGAGWENILKNGNGLESYSFQLQNIERKRGHWTLLYGAWEDYGSARQVAEIRVSVGKIFALDKDVGVAAYVRCFSPAIRHTKPLRGKLKDDARMIFKISDTTAPKWEFFAASSKQSLLLVGSDPTDSQRIQAGLNDDAYKSFKASKAPSKKFIPKCTETSRNNHLSYHKQWKYYPGTIVVSGDTNNEVNGTYRRLSCEQTIVLSALWRRDGSDGALPMYIYIRPDVDRAELDVAVIASTPSHKDGMEVCELEDWIPENALSDKISEHETKTRFLNWETDPNDLQLEVLTPTMSMTNPSRTFQERVDASTEDEASTLVLCEVSGLSNEVADVLLEYNDQNDQSIDLFGRSGTRNAKRLSIVAAPSLIKFAAEGKLSLTLSTWYQLPSSANYGHSEVHVPIRPREFWKEVRARDTNQKGKREAKSLIRHERVYDAEESNEYYQVCPLLVVSMLVNHPVIHWLN